MGLTGCIGERHVVVPHRRGGDAAWRNRKHMSFEARRAYERREAERREAAVKDWVGDNRPVAEKPKEERSWWDVEEQGIEQESAGIAIEVDDVDQDTDEEYIGPLGEVSELSRIENGDGQGWTTPKTQQTSTTER